MQVLVEDVPETKQRALAAGAVPILVHVRPRVLEF